MDTRKIAMTYANLCVSLVIVMYLFQDAFCWFFPTMSGRKFRSIRQRKQWARGPPAQTLLAPATQQQPEIESATAASSAAVQEPSGTPSRGATASKKKLSLHIFYWVRMVIVVTTRVIA